MMFQVYHICTLSNFHSTHACFFWSMPRKSVLRALLTWLTSVLQRHDGPDHHGDWNDAAELATYPAVKQPETQKRGFMAP